MLLGEIDKLGKVIKQKERQYLEIIKDFTKAKSKIKMLNSEHRKLNAILSRIEDFLIKHPARNCDYIDSSVTSIYDEILLDTKTYLNNDYYVKSLKQISTDPDFNKVCDAIESAKKLKEYIKEIIKSHQHTDIS